MAKTVAIGLQSFESIRERNVFYVDKTNFIKEWWESEDDVTLITRPRRFGKTLNMSMVEQFFSVDYANRGDLFEGLSIWENEKYRQLQGTYPVISLSFANVKETSYETTRIRICQLLIPPNNRKRYLRMKKSKSIKNTWKIRLFFIISAAVNAGRLQMIFSFMFLNSSLPTQQPTYSQAPSMMNL